MKVHLVYFINLRREGDNVPGCPFVRQEQTGSRFLTITNLFPKLPKYAVIEPHHLNKKGLHV